MIVIIDNYDSFTFNLYQMIAQLTPHVEVIRNDAISVEELARKKLKAIIISPGPGEPKDAGICKEMILKLGPTVPILGVCLGMQAIAEAYQGHVIRAKQCVHGKSALIFHRRQGIFKGMKLPFEAARYHSLVVEEKTLPSELIVEAFSSDDCIMALRHIKYPMWGVQFHPESILTQEGDVLVKNFLQQAGVL